MPIKYLLNLIGLHLKQVPKVESHVLEYLKGKGYVALTGDKYIVTPKGVRCIEAATKYDEDSVVPVPVRAAA